MQKINFSIIIPLHNKAKYVANSINSVMSQTYSNWELIIINDGSTDDSLQVAKNSIKNVERSISQKIKIISQLNSGVGQARNNGVNKSKGDYICFLDADDWWEPSFLEEIAQLITAYPEAGIYGTSYYIVKNGKKNIAPISLDKNFTKGFIDYIEVYSRNLCMPLFTGAVCIPGKVFTDMGGFKPHLKLGEDFDLWLRIALKYQVAFVNKPLVCYNQDVELSGRAVGHLYRPEQTEFYYYSEYEAGNSENKTLKQLLDNKRTYSLFYYFINLRYRNWAKQELSKVDWTKQPINVYRQYYSPLYMFIKFAKIKLYRLF